MGMKVTVNGTTYDLLREGFHGSGFAYAEDQNGELVAQFFPALRGKTPHDLLQPRILATRKEKDSDWQVFIGQGDRVSIKHCADDDLQELVESYSYGGT